MRMLPLASASARLRVPNENEKRHSGEMPQKYDYINDSLQTMQQSDKESSKAEHGQCRVQDRQQPRLENESGSIQQTPIQILGRERRGGNLTGKERMWAKLLFLITLPAAAMCIVGIYLLEKQSRDGPAGALVLAILLIFFLVVMACQAACLMSDEEGERASHMQVHGGY